MDKKKLTLITATTFATFIGMSNVASASSISSVNHELNQLTAGEQAKIKQGEAHVSDLKCGGVVHFVYKEKTGKVVTTTAKIEPMSKLPEQMKAQAVQNGRIANATHTTQVANQSQGRVVKALPQTGDSSNVTLGLIGFVMLGGGIYLVYRQKSKTSAMVVALLVGLGGFSTNALASNFGDVHQAIIEQDIVVHEDIEGYDYVGYFLESTGTCQLDQAKVEKDKEKVPESIIVDKTIVDKEKLPDVIIKEVPAEKIKEIIKYVPIEVIKEIPVEIIKEVPVEKIVTIIKEVPVEKLVTIIKEVPVEKVVTVIKEVPVEKVVTVIKEVPVEVIKEVPVEKIVTVIKEVPVEKIVTVIKEVPVEKIVTVIKEVPVEVIKTVEVEKIVTVVKEVPVEKIVTVVKEIPVEVIKEVPVEKIVTVIKEVPVEKIVTIVKEVPVEKIVTVIKEVPVEKIVTVVKEVPVEKIVEVIKEVKVETVKESIGYETEIVIDKSLPQGKTEIRTQGVNGEKINGVVTKEPVKQVIALGAKTEAVIPFNERFVYDNTLPLGTERVQTEGVNGKMVNGEVTSEKVDKVVVIGTKVVNVVPFDKKIIFDPTLDVNEKVVRTQGVNGEMVNGEITKQPVEEVIAVGSRERIIVPFNTKLVKDPTLPVGTETVRTEGVNGEMINGEVTTQAIDKVIVIGTKQVEKVPFDLEIRYDNTLPVGTEQVQTEGVVGEKVNGEVTKQPINKVVVVGTKQVSSVPFGTKIVYDNTMDVGTETVRTEGVNGEMTNGEITTAPTDKVVVIGTKAVEVLPFTYKEVEDAELPLGETIVVAGKNGEKVNGVVTKEPVDGVIRKGTKKPPVTSTVEKLPFETEIVYDNNLPAGTREVRTEGVLGERIRETGEVTKQPVKQVVVVGTKLVETIPYTYDEVEDPNLAIGQTVVTHGENGEKVNGVVTKEPVNGVIRKGAMPTEPILINFPDGRKIEYFGDIANLSNDEIFNKLNHENNDYIPNEITAPDGKIYTNPTAITFLGNNEYRVDYDVKHVTEIVPFDTEIVYDNNMISGTEEVRKQGVVGERVDGVITIQPVNKVVAVGTKCPPKPEPTPPTETVPPTEPEQPETPAKTPITITLPDGNTITVDVDNPDDLTAIANHPGIPPKVVKVVETAFGRVTDSWYGNKTISKTADGNYVVNYDDGDHEVEIEE